MKTFYVWPTCEVSEGNYVYWEGFIKLFNDLYYQDNPGSPELPEGKWLARIEPYEKAGIEVVVIGAPDCPYHPEDSHVMQIICKGLKGKCLTMNIDCRRGINKYCEASNYNYGHTHFMHGEWGHDTMGFTPGGSGQIRYGTPWIFPFAVENLFTEGAYKNLAVGEKPLMIRKNQNCNEGKPCYDPSEHCPNLNANLDYCYDFNHYFNEYPIGYSPFVKDGLLSVCRRPDRTAQLGKYTFSNEGVIQTILEIEEDKYNRRQVLARVVVHEMGHALLNKIVALPNNHHCNHRKCIMYEGFENFNLHDFGPGWRECQHEPGGLMDIVSCITT
jgi:hypothetical protein